MSIYDKRQEEVNGILVSMIRSSTPLHAGPMESRAEIMYCQDGHWNDLWSGHPAQAGDLFRWVVEKLKWGYSIDEVDDFILDREAELLD